MKWAEAASLAVCGGAVCFPMALDANQQAALKRLNDSKKLMPDTGGIITVILEAGVCGIGEANPAEIERLNIHYASLLAVYRAFVACASNWAFLRGDECFVVMDGRSLCRFAGGTTTRHCEGDAQSAVIAAASSSPSITVIAGLSRGP